MTEATSLNAVREFGDASGQPMLFAHGFGCDQAMWRFVTPQFENDFRVITFDHVGFGASDKSAWSAQRYATLQAYADDVLDIVHELDLREVIFVGHSVAAMIGLLAAVAEPDRFAHLILIGPSPRYIDDPEHGYVGGFTQKDIDDLLETLDSNHLGWSTGHGAGDHGQPGPSRTRPRADRELLPNGPAGRVDLRPRDLLVRQPCRPCARLGTGTRDAVFR